MARYDLPTYVLHVLGHFWMFAVKITEWLFSLKSLGLWTHLWTHLPIVWDKVPNKFGFFLTPSLRNHKRQCQIRVQFESVGMQFFKVLKKWFWMTKYVPIIVLWCSERGFYKKSHLITCFRRFTNAPNHLAVYVRILGQVDFGKNSKSCQYWHWIFRVLH